MKSVGGYFNLELNDLGSVFHDNAISLNTGRNALEYIIRTKHYKKVYLSFYTCSALLEPLERLNVAYEFYDIDENFRPVFDFKKLHQNEVFIYTNYFGICTQQAVEVVAKTKSVIIDNAQSFFAQPLPNIDTFYSPRKFFGVTDGGFLYTNTILDYKLDVDKSYERFMHLLGSIDGRVESFYNTFQKNETQLDNQPIKRMSNLTYKILRSVNYNEIAQKRKDNFKYLHSSLKDANKLKFSLNDNEVPLCYPFYLEQGKQLKKSLISKKIFVPTYWPNVFDWAANDSIAYDMADNIVSLPIDQRYDLEDMKFVIDTIKNIQN